MVGSFTAVCGVLVMALPIPIVVENFGAYYMEQKKRAGIAAKRMEIEEVRTKEEEAGEFEMKQLTRVLSEKMNVK